MKNNSKKEESSSGSKVESSFVDFKPIKHEHKKLNFIFSILKEAKDDSDNPIKFLSNLYSILCSSLFVIILMLFSTCLPICMLIIGILNIQDCKIDFKIPIWLIVTGCIGILYLIIRILASIQLRKRNIKTRSHQVDPYYITYLTLLLSLFQFVWFLCGNAWILSVYNSVNTTPSSTSNTCNRICYLFAFWSILACWICAGVLILFIVGLVLYFVISLICQKYDK